MKALSIRGLWAWAIFHLPNDRRKNIENRSWPTRKRGRFAVHMSKGLTRREYNDVRLILSSEYGVPLEVIPAIKDLPLGKILGTVYLANCVTESDSRWFCGEYGFVLRDAIALAEPVVCAGGLGFWEVPAGLLPFADSK